MRRVTRPDFIAIDSAVHGATGAPAVIFQWGREKGVLTVTQARDHAMAVLEAAEAAETDALLREWSSEHGLKVDVVLKSLRMSRVLRRERETPAT